LSWKFDWLDDFVDGLQYDCGLIIKDGELHTVVLVKTNEGLCLDFRKNPREIILSVRVETRHEEGVPQSLSRVSRKP